MNYRFSGKTTKFVFINFIDKSLLPVGAIVIFPDRTGNYIFLPVNGNNISKNIGNRFDAMNGFIYMTSKTKGMT